jgi:hypothetical protein
MNRKVLLSVLTGFFVIGLVGCMEKTASSKSETTITTPGGKTTVTTERAVKKSGDNPPNTP